MGLCVVWLDICHLSDIFGDGHFVIVQHHNQVVQVADVVHALIDHAAGERAIPDDGNDLAGFFFQLFGACHTDGGGKRRAAVPRNKGITVAFLRGGKARKAIHLAQMGEASRRPVSSLWV